MEYKKEIESQLFTRLFSINNPYLDFNMSNFSVFNNNSIDRGDGTNSKIGCGRVRFYLDSQLPHCYTLECHYS